MIEIETVIHTWQWTIARNLKLLVCQVNCHVDKNTIFLTILKSKHKCQVIGNS